MGFIFFGFFFGFFFFFTHLILRENSRFEFQVVVGV